MSTIAAHRSYSIAEAKNHLSGLVHEVEEQGPVELTRRGRPVAMVISMEEFERLQQPKAGVWDAIRQWRAEMGDDLKDLDPDEIWGGIRSSSAGRDFAW